MSRNFVYAVLLHDPIDVLVYEYSSEGFERAKAAILLAKDEVRAVNNIPYIRVALGGDD